MLTLVVQAGGESRRMGRDKALAPFLGRPLIQRVLERVQHLAQEIIVTSNQPENYTFLGLPIVPDVTPGRGALGGLFTALQAASQPLVAIVACDMPFVSPELLQVERSILSGEQPGVGARSGRPQPYDAAIPRLPGGTEPFHALYRKDTCLPLVGDVLQKDLWRVDAWFDQAHIYFLPSDQVRQIDPQGLAFWNVNTPEELARAEVIARQSDNA